MSTVPMNSNPRSDVASWIVIAVLGGVSIAVTLLALLHGSAPPVDLVIGP
jgi:hypothetical protein